MLWRNHREQLATEGFLNINPVAGERVAAYWNDSMGHRGVFRHIPNYWLDPRPDDILKFIVFSTVHDGRLGLNLMVRGGR